LKNVKMLVNFIKLFEQPFTLLCMSLLKIKITTNNNGNHSK